MRYVETPPAAMLRVFGISAWALGLLLGAKAALADTPPSCPTYTELAQQLEQRYAEIPLSLGLSRGGEVVQVFSSADGATWTMVLTKPDGTSCIVAAGEHWEALSGERPGPQA